MGETKKKEKKAEKYAEFSRVLARDSILTKSATGPNRPKTSERPKIPNRPVKKEK